MGLMNVKEAKKQRIAGRKQYAKALEVWKELEPSKWHFIKHRRWKRRMPPPPKDVVKEARKRTISVQ